MGRMWHTLLLSKWHQFFAWLPIETLIQEQQQDYYRCLNTANSSGCIPETGGEENNGTKETELYRAGRCAEKWSMES